jgi:hypothetical protein
MRKTKSRKVRSKRHRKTKRYKGGFGFFSDISYLIQNQLSFLSTNPVVPYGNASNPVPPFPYFQNN